MDDEFKIKDLEEAKDVAGYDPSADVRKMQETVQEQSELRESHGSEVQTSEQTNEVESGLSRQTNCDGDSPGRNSQEGIGEHVVGARGPTSVLLSTDVIVGKSGPSSAGWSSIEAGWRCLKEYQYQHIRHIKKPQHVLPSAFGTGSGFHAGRAKWFALKFRTDEAALEQIRTAILSDLEEQRLPSTIRTEQNSLNYVMEYIAYWSVRPKPTPVATEYLLGPAALEPDHPFYFHRTARLDDVSKYPEAGNALCIGESKTTSASISDCINQYTLHGQTLLQLILWKLAPQGEATLGPVAGIVLDITQKGYGGNKSKFAKEFIPITDRSIAWYVKNMSAFLGRLQSIDWNTEAPRNITSCTRIVGRGRIACDFRDLCVHGRSASIKYVLGDGSSLLTWKQTDERNVAPWD